MGRIFTRDGYDYYHVERAEQMAWCGVPRRFCATTWGALEEPKAKALRDALAWLRSWSRETGIYTVVLHGMQGTGKTTAAAAVFAQAVDKVRRPRWVSWPELVATVADSWSWGGERETLRGVVEAGFLVLDDFGKELTGPGADDARARDWHKRVAFEVINGRYTKILPTLLTTELGPVEMASRLDHALTSRLCEEGRWIDFTSVGDRRLARARQQRSESAGGK